MLSFFGDASAVSAPELVEQLISSFCVVPAKSRLLRIWRKVFPEIERFESKP